MSLAKSVSFKESVYLKIKEEVSNKQITFSQVVNNLIEEAFESRENKKNNCNKSNISNKQNNLKTRKPSELLSRKQKKEFKERFKPLIENLGAKRISEGVYELNGFLCYPSTNNAVNTRDRSIKMNLEAFIKKQKE